MLSNRRLIEAMQRLSKVVIWAASCCRQAEWGPFFCFGPSFPSLGVPLLSAVLAWGITSQYPWLYLPGMLWLRRCLWRLSGWLWWQWWPHLSTQCRPRCDLQCSSVCGLSTIKGDPNLILNSLARPADIFLPNWSCGLPTSFGVHVISPLQQQTLGEAASTPGHSLRVGVKH